MALYAIAAVGLRLSLDDELTLHCYDKDGYVIQLNDVSCLVITLNDGKWSQMFTPEDAMLEKTRLQYDLDEGILPPALKDCGK